MIILRAGVLAFFAAIMATGIVADRRPPEPESLPAEAVVAAPQADGRAWFCTGGSAGDSGPAVVGLEIVNASPSRVEPVITVMGAGPDQIVSETVAVEPYGRTGVLLAEMVGGSAWVAAVVEVTAPDVVVDQTHQSRSEGAGGVDRSSCATRAASTVLLPDGATRSIVDGASLGEELTLLLFTPFHNDSIVEVVFDADVGPDRLDAVVVPGRRVIAIDVNSEVTEAARISTTVNVEAGAVLASRVQVRDGEQLRGLSVTPGIAEGAVVSVLPSVRVAGGADIVSVTNPSRDARAEVDLEILTDGSISLDPIRLTIRPGRTVQVDLGAEARLARLANLEDFSILARSLNGLPVAVMVEQRVPLVVTPADGSAAAASDETVGDPAAQPDAADGAEASQEVPGVAAMGATDAASTRWLAPLESPGGAISVVNPSPTDVATVTVSAAGAGTASPLTTELAPGRRISISGEQLGTDRPIAVVEASSAVVVGRSYVGSLASRSLMAGVIAGPATPLADLS